MPDLDSSDDRPAPYLRRVRFRAEYLFVAGAGMFVRALPRPVAMAAGTFLGTLAWLALRHDRVVARANLDVVLGDARLEMEHELARGEPQTFDLLALDAFSSDAIPVHLLTAEAVAVYLKHLKPDGVIAIHVSNRYLELEPVVESLAARFDLGFVCIEDDIQDDWWQYSTTWMLLSRNRAFLAHPDIVAVANKTPAARTVAPWTDEKADLYSIMK